MFPTADVLHCVCAAGSYLTGKEDAFAVSLQEFRSPCNSKKYPAENWETLVFKIVCCLPVMHADSRILRQKRPKDSTHVGLRARGADAKWAASTWDATETSPLSGEPVCLLPSFMDRLPSEGGSHRTQSDPRGCHCHARCWVSCHSVMASLGHFNENV